MTPLLVFIGLTSVWCLGLWMYLIWCLIRVPSNLKWLLLQAVGTTVAIFAFCCSYFKASWIISYGCFIVGGALVGYGTIIHSQIRRK